MCTRTHLTDDVVDDAFSDMLRQAILLAEVLHEKTLLLAAVLPRRRREAVDIMVINNQRVLAAFHFGGGNLEFSFLSEKRIGKKSANSIQSTTKPKRIYYYLTRRSRATAPSTLLVPRKQHPMLLRLMPSSFHRSFSRTANFNLHINFQKCSSLTLLHPP